MTEAKSTLEKLNRNEAYALVDGEISRAIKKFGPFVSSHEGFAIIKEEVDELWDAVKMQHGPERDTAMRKEAIQVAAMAIRFLFDL